MLPQYSHQTDLSNDIDAENLVKIASELSFLDPTEQGDFFAPNPGQKMYGPQKNFVLPQYSIPQKKSGFLNKALRPRSLAWVCWENVYLTSLCKY